MFTIGTKLHNCLENFVINSSHSTSNNSHTVMQSIFALNTNTSFTLLHSVNSYPDNRNVTLEIKLQLATIRDTMSHGNTIAHITRENLDQLQSKQGSIPFLKLKCPRIFSEVQTLSLEA